MYKLQLPHPLKKVNPLFPSKPPLKSDILSSSQPFFENLVRGSAALHFLHCKKGEAGEVHTLNWIIKYPEFSFAYIFTPRFYNIVSL